MQRFNAKLNLISYGPLETLGEYTLTVSVVDNLGLYSFMDLQAGDLIYINGSDLGYPITMQYRLEEILDNFDPENVTLRVTYLNPVDVGGPFDPFGSEAIIGRPNLLNVLQLPEPTTYMLTEVFINAIRNYQTDLLSTGGSSGLGQTETFTTLNVANIDKQTNSIMLPEQVIDSSLMVIYNGQVLTPILDYSVVSHNQLVFTESALDAEVILIKYLKLL